MKNIVKFLFSFAIVPFSLTSCMNSNVATLIYESKDKVKLDSEYIYSEPYQTFEESTLSFASKFSSYIYQDYKNTYDNLVVSPASMYMGLAMAAASANNSSREEILKALNISSYDELIDNIPTFYSLLNDENHFGVTNFTNSLWLDTKCEFKDEGLKELSNNFFTTSYYGDFFNQNKEMNKSIQNYVKDKTKGLINNEFKFSENTMLVLLNILYYKDIWNELGDDLPYFNKEIEFKNKNGEISKKKFLEGYYNVGQVYESEKYETFYTKTKRNYTLQFIKPKEGYSIDEVFNESTIKEIENIESYNPYDEVNKIRYHTRTIFPEFEGEFNEDLLDFMKNRFNLLNSTNEVLADFSSIIKEDFLKESNVFISTIIHITKLKVNKKGIEGAAVTAIGEDGATGDGPIEYKDIYKDFIIDKTFGFYIKDSNGNIIFSGVINKI